MNLDSLRTFCALVETGSFSVAAGRVHLTQPAVSQQIKALEKEVGGPLFDRHTATPTIAGKLVYERARRMLLDADGLIHALRDIEGLADQELCIGSSDTMAMYFLPSIIRQFSKKMPNTHLKVVCRSTSEIVERVHRGECQLGLVTLPTAHPELDETVLFEESLYLVVPLAHRLAKKRSASLTDLVDEDLLMLDENTRTGALLRQFFRRESFEPRSVLDSGSFEVIKRYVAEGVGISFLPASALAAGDARIKTVRVSGTPKTTMGAIRLHQAYLTPGQRLLLQLMRERSKVILE